MAGTLRSSSAPLQAAGTSALPPQNIAIPPTESLMFPLPRFCCCYFQYFFHLPLSCANSAGSVFVLLRFLPALWLFPFIFIFYFVLFFYITVFAQMLLKIRNKLLYINVHYYRWFYFIFCFRVACVGLLLLVWHIASLTPLMSLMSY